ncbi:hypothetical protein E5288_WYG003146 [Bos mutus]|uniref:Uncharacterized protein n=1 Tax=Bos mutus TaxID=72004 RepID=A0A6B0RAI1_9CETA|nr:hypothetical protein [Bos mutus]
MFRRISKKYTHHHANRNQKSSHGYFTRENDGGGAETEPKEQKYRRWREASTSTPEVPRACGIERAQSLYGFHEIQGPRGLAGGCTVHNPAFRVAAEHPKKIIHRHRKISTAYSDVENKLTK